MLNSPSLLKNNLFYLSKMDFTALPDVLQNMVCAFAFGITKKEVERDLITIREIKQWKLPSNFFEKFVFDKNLQCYVVTPLSRYFPLTELSNCKVLFDYYRIGQVIERLDFRKKQVKFWGTRWQWKEFLKDWTFYGLFAEFYRNMIKNGRQVVKPLYKHLNNPLNWFGYMILD